MQADTCQMIDFSPPAHGPSMNKIPLLTLAVVSSVALASAGFSQDDGGTSDPGSDPSPTLVDCNGCKVIIRQPSSQWLEFAEQNNWDPTIWHPSKLFYLTHNIGPWDGGNEHGKVVDVPEWIHKGRKIGAIVQSSDISAGLNQFEKRPNGDYVLYRFGATKGLPYIGETAVATITNIVYLPAAGTCTKQGDDCETGPCSMTIGFTMQVAQSPFFVSDRMYFYDDSGEKMVDPGLEPPHSVVNLNSSKTSECQVGSECGSGTCTGHGPYATVNIEFTGVLGRAAHGTTAHIPRYTLATAQFRCAQCVPSHVQQND